MAKAIGVVGSPQRSGDKILIAVSVTVVVPGNVNAGIDFVSSTSVTGSENPQQLNAALNTVIKKDALEAYGITLVDTDISTTKFS